MKRYAINCVLKEDWVLKLEIVAKLKNTLQFVFSFFIFEVLYCDTLLIWNKTVYSNKIESLRPSENVFRFVFVCLLAEVARVTH